MATRSLIGKLEPNGNVMYIYCHWDGYPEHNGVILKEFYNTEDKVNELLSLGDLSSLGKEIGEKHDFDKPTPGWCISYGRDRGEEEVGVSVVNTKEEFIKASDNIDYVYLFSENKWTCYNYDGLEVEIVSE